MVLYCSASITTSLTLEQKRDCFPISLVNICIAFFGEATTSSTIGGDSGYLQAEIDGVDNRETMEDSGNYLPKNLNFFWATVLK